MVVVGERGTSRAAIWALCRSEKALGRRVAPAGISASRAPDLRVADAGARLPFHVEPPVGLDKGSLPAAVDARAASSATSSSFSSAKASVPFSRGSRSCSLARVTGTCSREQESATMSRAFRTRASAGPSAAEPGMAGSRFSRCCVRSPPPATGRPRQESTVEGWLQLLLFADQFPGGSPRQGG